MVNLLVADDNLNFSKQIINEVLKDNVRVCKLATNGEETLKILDTEKIDVVILDINMPILSGIEVLKKIRNKQFYKQSIVILSGDSSFFPTLMNNDLIYDYIIKGTQLQEVIIRVNRLIKQKDIVKKRNQIYVELKKLGYDVSHNGTNYLQDVIMEMYLHDEFSVNSLQRDIYPIISQIYHKTVHNIKCNINNATEMMYCNSNHNILKKYFNFYDDEKPTTKTVIYTILSKIK